MFYPFLCGQTIVIISVPTSLTNFEFQLLQKFQFGYLLIRIMNYFQIFILEFYSTAV
jgi:hypothetical protein